MSRARSILGTLAWVAAAATACTTTYTEEDVVRLENQRDAEEAKVAREEETGEGPSLNQQLLDEQQSWLETESDR